MKNSPNDVEDVSRPHSSAPWREALALFDADLRRRGMAEKTRRAYDIDVSQFALWCTTQDIAPRDVGAKDLNRYAEVLARRETVAAPIARKLAALRAFYRTLREHGQVARSPTDLIPSPERPRPQPAVLRPDELAALLDRIPAATPLELRDRALLEVAYACGLRAEELVSLDVASVDFDAAHLRVNGNGAKARIVAAEASPLKALARYLDRARPALAAGDGDQALFLSKSGRRLSTSDVRRRLRVWARHAAVQGGVSPHTLRHSFASQVLEGGTDLHAIQDLLGHASVSTTQIYSRVESARLKSAYARSHPRA
jgi:integrase/recombinase XerC/integrase/recombinase XerD